MRCFIIWIFCFSCIPAFAQNDSTKSFKIEGYIEAYYSYDFAKPFNHERPHYYYNHKRHNEININLAVARISYQRNYIRATVTPMIGTYAEYNLASEPDWAKFVYEANFGVKLLKESNVYLDAGIFTSHLGYETPIGIDSWTLTRTILAENHPYYESGLRLNYVNDNNTLNTSFYYLNGWQKIRKPSFSQLPSFGYQFNYTLSDQWVFNYSNFMGYDKPDSLKAFRHYHNMYIKYTPSGKLGLLNEWGVGSEQRNGDNQSWWVTSLAAKYSIKEKSIFVARGEYYHDPKNIIISAIGLSGFEYWGLSIGYDYKLNKNTLVRIEWKRIKATEGTSMLKANNALAVAACLKIE